MANVVNNTSMENRNVQIGSTIFHSGCKDKFSSSENKNFQGLELIKMLFSDDFKKLATAAQRITLRWCKPLYVRVAN